MNALGSICIYLLTGAQNRKSLKNHIAYIRYFTRRRFVSV